jgi:FKBP-type peptidyl-prolyl cis-trans isomerase
MKSFFLIVFALISVSAVAQSKKELKQQVTTLTTEVQQLKAENAKLSAPKVVDINSDFKRLSYSMGMLMASNIQSQGVDSVDLDAIAFAFTDVFTKQQPKIEQQEALSVVQEYFGRIREEQAQKLRAEGIAFLEQNKKDPEVKVTASGMQYKVITAGKGKSPKATDQVTVHYTGKLIDGTVFDSSEPRGEPTTFGVNQVIAGWTEALQLMKEGDKWLIFIPDNLAYGEAGAGGGAIPPYATLIFEVQLIKVN